MTPIVIFGSRTFSKIELLPLIVGPLILRLNRDVEIVSGGAKGADCCAWAMARSFGLPYKEFPANWNLYGKKAGPLRNEQMAEYCAYSYGFALWDGSSPGTRDMIARCEAHDINVHVELYLEQTYKSAAIVAWQRKLKKS